MTYYVLYYNHNIKASSIYPTNPIYTSYPNNPINPIHTASVQRKYHKRTHAHDKHKQQPYTTSVQRKYHKRIHTHRRGNSFFLDLLARVQTHHSTYPHHSYLITYLHTHHQHSQHPDEKMAFRQTPFDNTKTI